MSETTGTESVAAAALTPELRRLSTWVGRRTVRQVTAESVRRFSASTQPASLCRSDGSRLVVEGHDVVPPTYFCPDPVVEVEAMGLVRPAVPVRSIDGGSRWTLRNPVRVGDTLTSIGQVTSVDQRKTRDGRDLVETRFDILVWNQHGQSVGVAGGTIVNYQEHPS
jgi:N-terminal half of MaoC dehydratase